MSWMSKLYETYEYAKAMHLDINSEHKLNPIRHTSQKAHIHIVLDGSGNFKRAEIVKQNIILPCTESSEGRTSGAQPHPLSDKLQYIAKDCKDYCKNKSSYFEKYIKLLRSWCDSKYSHPKVRAIYMYVSKGTCIKDLLKAHILYSKNGSELFIPTPGMLQSEFEKSSKPEIFNVIEPNLDRNLDQSSALVCWSVEVENDPLSRTWEDETIQKSWIDFSEELDTVTGLCFIQGKEMPLALNHPAKIRYPGDKAKLISSNDKDGFTFLGRFTDSKESIKKIGYQAVGVGLVTTEKAHSALRWLISRQGYHNGEQVIVAWAVSGKEIPQPTEDSYSLLKNASFNLTKNDAAKEQSSVIDQTRDLGQTFATNLKKCMIGYRAKLNDFESINIMAIDSAIKGKGRMAITYYRECLAKDFITQIQSWHLDFSWPQRHSIANDMKKKSKVIWLPGVPALDVIAKAAYGNTLTESLKKNIYERIIPCIIEGVSFPIDIVRACVQRASNMNSSECWEWERNIGIACALYRGYFKRHPNIKERRSYTMSLDNDIRSRDYLYGRLLAIAENIESYALYHAGENRPTMAQRLMQRFADKPFTTWRNIELALQPYIQRLQNSHGSFIYDRKKQLDIVTGMFIKDDFTNEKELTGEFLLGYHCQRLSFENKNKSAYNLEEGNNTHESTE